MNIALRGRKRTMTLHDGMDGGGSSGGATHDHERDHAYEKVDEQHDEYTAARFVPLPAHRRKRPHEQHVHTEEQAEEHSKMSEQASEERESNV
jgi:hypothetical protein